VPFRKLIGAVSMLGLAVDASAHAAPAQFDLRCHYVKVYGHESYGGIHIPYRGPRVRTEHLAIDLNAMTKRWLYHGIVSQPSAIPKVTGRRIWLESTPYLQMTVDRSNGRYIDSRIENDNSRFLFEGRCRFASFTPPDPPGQPYRGW
jgi:hypothetical protein